MDEDETIKKDAEELEHLEEEIQTARQHLAEETHEKEKHEQAFYGENEGPVPG